MEVIIRDVEHCIFAVTHDFEGFRTSANRRQPVRNKGILYYRRH